VCSREQPENRARQAATAIGSWPVNGSQMIGRDGCQAWEVHHPQTLRPPPVPAKPQRTGQRHAPDIRLVQVRCITTWPVRCKEEPSY